MSEAASLNETIAFEMEQSSHDATSALSGSSPIIMDVRGLTKKFYLTGSDNAVGGLFGRGSGNEFCAVNNVSFTLRRGERLGVIGQNGAGKSTLLKVLSRVLLPTAGEVDIYGRVTALLEVGTGFNPELTGIQNIHLNGALHGIGREKLDECIEQIEQFSELGSFLQEKIKFYSTGMRARLGFAVAAHLDPDILILDEVLSVGDAAFQRKCLSRMEGLTGEGRTLVFVSHSTSAVRKFCNRCLWLDRGEVVRDGNAIEVCDDYDAQMANVSSVYQSVDVREEAGNGALPSGNRMLDEAPAAKLHAAMVCDSVGEPARSIRIDQPCVIKLVFDVLVSDQRVEPALHVRDEYDEIRFVAAFTDAAWSNGANEIGRYCAQVEIPGNLMNEGLHFVTISLSTADPLRRHHEVHKAVSFSVYELADMPFGVTARGNYARSFPGSVRPRFEWQLEREGK